VYRKNTFHAFLLSPALWEGSGVRNEKPEVRVHMKEARLIMNRISFNGIFSQTYPFEILE